MKILAGLSLLSAAVYGFQDVRKNLNGDKVVDIHFDHIGAARELLEGHEIDHFGKNDDSISVKLSPEAVAALEAEGVKFKDTTEQWISDLQANFDDPSAFCFDSDEECAARSLDSFYSSYQTLEALTARWKSAVNASPLAKFKVIGKSYEGRDMNLVEIGDHTKPLAYFMCNIHAREWLPSMYCTYMIETLLANGGHKLLDTFSFSIIPHGNPDGFVYSRNVNNMWRKTRNINSGSSCVGTDPNRNYGDHHCQKGTSNNPCSDIYCGPEPFSTKETEAINNYGASVADRLISWIDFHSYGGYWLSPLGYDKGKPPAVDYDRMIRCMTAAVQAVQDTNGQRFKAGPAGDLLGAAAGASDDWFYFGWDVTYSFTCEMRGTSFQPSASNIMPSNLEIFAGMNAQMECIAAIELGKGVVPPLPAEVEPEEAPCKWFFC